MKKHTLVWTLALSMLALAGCSAEPPQSTDRSPNATDESAQGASAVSTISNEQRDSVLQKFSASIRVSDDGIRTSSWTPIEHPLFQNDALVDPDSDAVDDGHQTIHAMPPAGCWYGACCYTNDVGQATVCCFPNATGVHCYRTPIGGG